MLRVRELIIQPGGIMPWHDHGDRPVLIQLVRGGIIEHCSTCAVPVLHKAGEFSVETRDVMHWWQNTSRHAMIRHASDILHEADDPHVISRPMRSQTQRNRGPRRSRLRASRHAQGAAPMSATSSVVTTDARSSLGERRGAALRVLSIGAISFLTLVHLFAAQALRPPRVREDGVSLATWGCRSTPAPSAWPPLEWRWRSSGRASTVAAAWSSAWRSWRYEPRGS